MDRYENFIMRFFFDVLFCYNLGIVFLFILSFLLIRSLAEQHNVRTKAEFLFTITWQDNSDDDVDSWLEDPTGSYIYYQQLEQRFMHLDRDDIGTRGKDCVEINGIEKCNPTNQELVTIRGFIPGWWTFNLFMFNKREKEPATVTVTIQKLNPKAETIHKITLVMTRTTEEITILRFLMDSNGEIIDKSFEFKDVVTDIVRANAITNINGNATP